MHSFPIHDEAEAVWSKLQGCDAATVGVTWKTVLLQVKQDTWQPGTCLFLLLKPHCSEGL